MSALLLCENYIGGVSNGCNVTKHQIEKETRVFI